MKGIATFVPGVGRLANRGAGGPASARYCYSVWLRHLVMAHKSGLSTQADVVAELGPGDSLGDGLAALLSGASQYFALDVKEHASDHRNVEVFDELVNLFARQENIPDEIEFPNVKPYLESYEFPDHVLTQSRLQQTLDEGRIASIRDSLSRLGSDRQPNSHIAYVFD